MRSFLTKMHKIWIHDYWNKNASNGTFHFSVSYRTQFHRINSLAYHFFVIFIRKLSQVLVLTLIFRTLDDLTEKRKTLSDFPSYKIRISIVFLRLRSKLTSEMCPKLRSFDEKTEQNFIKVMRVYLQILCAYD